MPKAKFTAGRFDPEPTVPTVNVTNQIDALFVTPGIYDAVGVYRLSLVPIPGVNTANDVFWTGNAFTAGHILTLQPGFVNGQATVGVRITDGAGNPVEDDFYVHADFDQAD